jgi:hypothetical protein
MNQRWLFGRSSYRPEREPINPSEFEVAPIADDTTAKRFVEAHHYSKSYPAARWRFGLYRGQQLAGVAVFSVPPNNAVLTNVFPGDALESTELGRFVLLDSVEGNGETWFLARCFKALRKEGLIGVLAFSDPVERRNRAGELLKPGHVGTIYQAASGVFLGRGRAGTLHVFEDGTTLSNRAISKIKAMKKGWKYASELLVLRGAAPLSGNPSDWLHRWVPRLTYRLPHPGNFKYAWPLDRKVQLPPSLPYPKRRPA